MAVKLEREFRPQSSPDVLLVLPPLYQTGREPDYNPKEPMGLMYLAASLRRDGRLVEIFDADIEARTIKQTADRIMAQSPPIVGFSVFQRALPSFELIVGELRNLGYGGHITCGGITPTLSYPYILDRLGDRIDSLVLGDGEEIIRNLTDRILCGQDWKGVSGVAYKDRHGLVVNRPMDVVDLDAQPFAARDYLAHCLGKTNYATLMGSRGCYGICTFCSNFAFEDFHSGPRWRARNPEKIVDEIQALHESYGVTVFKFNDPNIFGPGRRGRDHVVNVCLEIQRRKLPLHLMGFCRSDDITADLTIVPILRSAGFERLPLGIESSNDGILSKFRKGETTAEMEAAMDVLDRTGISTVIGFMIFNPYTTISSLKQDLVFLRKRHLFPTLSKALRVFDGTPIQALLEQEGRLVCKNPFEGYHNYLMPREVAAVYASMKLLFTHCLDRIRAVGQGKIWDVKKSVSFRDRQDFNNLAEAFFSVESSLLDRLIIWAETGDFAQEDVMGVVSGLYSMFSAIGRALSIDINEVLTEPEILAKEIYVIMKEQPWNTFREEYRWNQD